MPLRHRGVSPWRELGADYYVSDAWTVGGLVQGYLGAKRSEFASTAQAASVLFKVARYLRLHGI
jgi:hypothetical protein